MTDETAENEVTELERLRCAATKSGDLGSLENVLADDYQHVTGRGKIMDKQGYLNWVKELPRSHERSNLSIRIYGDTAVLIGDLLNRLQDKAGERVVDAIVTQVARREGARWRFVSFHITPKHPL